MRLKTRFFTVLLTVLILDMIPLVALDEALTLHYQGKPAAALKKLRPFLKKGNPQAYHYGAIIYLFGENPQPSLGLPLLEKAVQKNYAPALDTYAGLFLHGEFVEKDPQKALIYYELAARQGYGPSQFNCGILYKKGEKIPKDLLKAFLYLTMATNNKKDLDELTEDAEAYRNQVIKEMSPEDYQKALFLYAKNS